MGKQWECALRLLNAMWHRRVLANATSYNAAISACGNCAKWQDTV